MRIEICGGIASGKTTLAKLLEENKIGKVIYEKFERPLILLNYHMF